MQWLLPLMLFLMLRCCSGLNMHIHKEAFFSSLARGESVKDTDVKLQRLIENAAVAATEAIQAPSSPSRNLDVSQSTWRIAFAPHIRVLQSLLQTKFDVFYHFQNDGSTLVSSVRYDSFLFGSGHLCTSGSYSISSRSCQERSERSEAVCKIAWDRIWWDTRSLSDGPSKETEVHLHVLPGLIQMLGKAAFIEGVSVFPVQYKDEDLCVFLFELFGTRIAAQKIA